MRKPKTQGEASWKPAQLTAQLGPAATVWLQIMLALVIQSPQAFHLIPAEGPVWMLQGRDK